MGIFDGFLGGGDNSLSMPKPEDLLEYYRLQQGFNQQDTTTPFGSVTYTDANQPMSFDEWSAGQPQQQTAMGFDDWLRTGQNSLISDQGGARQNAYNNYLRGIRGGPSMDAYSEYKNSLTPDMQMGVEFSPEIQGLFDKQFDPNAYDMYKDDYMEEFRYRTDPVFARQDDRFEQGMFDRGQPQGGELYNEQYLLKEQAQNDALASAIRQAGLISDNARIQDYNRIMGAFGGTQVQANPIDVMGPLNMAMNVNATNAANQSSIWDSLPMLAGSYMMGAPDDAAIWKMFGKG